MDFEPFYKICESSLSDSEKKFSASFYKSVDGTFGVDEVPQFGNIKAIANLYSRSSSLSRAQFLRKKRFVVRLYNWLYEENYISKETHDYVCSITMEDILAANELSGYFKNLQLVLEFIKIVGARKGFNSEDDLLRIKAIAILLWYSLDAREISEMKISDIDIRTSTIRVKRGGEYKSIEVDAPYFNILLRLSSAQSYKAFPSDRVFYFVDSPYLLKSSRKGKLEPVNIVNLVSKFNGEAEKYGAKIGFCELKQNGMYYRVHQRKDEELSITAIIMEESGCDMKTSTGHKKRFEAWEKQFYESV